ncbi:hypothetical protein M407DRAFT_207086 [Tulasnella calospora MUT 4182]|uniref:Uncharacterized protein n=1 Tax=Tulasnella calospora MUT 4182 TaxID=1051891 RepID=A0A0C3QIK7_9AGAM|nr:hypothetical protein M407DRAFT_207086 [Tulasnella calospora MUT 4182]
MSAMSIRMENVGSHGIQSWPSAFGGIVKRSRAREFWSAGPARHVGSYQCIVHLVGSTYARVPQVGQGLHLWILRLYVQPIHYSVTEIIHLESMSGIFLPKGK